MSAIETAASLAVVLAYHERTKHSLERYAAGPETLDWDAQPDPFRRFAGAPRTLLPLAADTLATGYAELHVPGRVPPKPMNIATVGLLLELSMAISAWKQYGTDRWALRCNPSSGNLHPTEAYVICRDIPGLADGVHHYLSLDHSLELRGRIAPGADASPLLHVALTSITWREAWKYGERAFRYCQHDVGHALGALRYAAAALGWRAVPRDDMGSEELARLLGTDRDADFGAAEREEPELLLSLGAEHFDTQPVIVEWFGQANVLDRRPLYRWPIIDEVARATRKPATPRSGWHPEPRPTVDRANDIPAATLFRQRRSAQAFRRGAELAAADFHRMLDALLPRDAAPWDVWGREPCLHLVLFVHRIAGLIPGLYALPRSAAGEQLLRDDLRDDFEWTRPAGCPPQLPLLRLIAAGTERAARTASCHQAIAADSAFSLAMLAEFEAPLAAAPWRYRHLFWEAGLVGQVLYLEAEAAGVRGTGIGCYFDDVVHELFGIDDHRLQSLYHFTVGTPLTDERITTLPPYPMRPHLDKLE